MTGMLASINSLEEALQVQSLNIDIIDLKNPAQGALGALPLQTVRQIVATLGPEQTISATIGDLPMQTDCILNAVQEMGQTGVDYIKIGFFPGENNRAIIQALGCLIQSNKLHLIAVLMADENPDFSLLPDLAEAGFAGVMLDTANKQNGSLPDVIAEKRLRQFVESARRHRLLTGLAGSLRPQHIDDLLCLKPDYLGFRGALCKLQQRTRQLDPRLIRQVSKHFIDSHHATTVRTLSVAT